MEQGQKIVLISFTCIVVLLVLFCILACIYSFTKKHLFKKFFHDFLGWHINKNKYYIENDQVKSTCVVCHKTIVEDFQGNWWEV